MSLSSPLLTTVWFMTPACHIAQQTCPTGYMLSREKLIVCHELQSSGLSLLPILRKD